MRELPRSLAEVLPDEAVVVRRILFGCLRARCAELGVHEGDVVSVASHGTPTLVLRRPDRSLVRCPADVARFIEVQDELRP
jgi:hypothetical protein